MALTRRAAFVVAGLLASGSFSSAARADDPAPKVDADDTHEATEAWLRYIGRSHTIALLEAGIIVLPFAPISQSQKGGALPIFNVPVGQGDATIQLGIHILYRPVKDWSFGANFLFDPKPTDDTEYGGLSGLPRTHSRNYFFIGGEVRYIPLHTRAIEAFVGAQSGVVIVADRFTTNTATDKPAIFGDGEVSLSTEGFSARSSASTGSSRTASSRDSSRVTTTGSSPRCRSARPSSTARR